MKLSLRSARINANKRVEDVARALGVNKQTVYNWEQGKTEPKQSQIMQLAWIYNLKVEELE